MADLRATYVVGAKAWARYASSAVAPYAVHNVEILEYARKEEEVMYFPISICKINGGFYATVGCQQFAFGDSLSERLRMIRMFREYILDPDTARKKYVVEEKGLPYVTQAVQSRLTGIQTEPQQREEPSNA